MGWEFRAELPIYTQLMEKLRGQIVSGGYLPGDKLPSVRELALDAGINPNTVQRAFADLEREGLIYSQRTAGRFVTEDEDRIREAKKQAASESIRQFLNAMQKIGYTKQQILSLLAEQEEET